MSYCNRIEEARALLNSLIAERERLVSATVPYNVVARLTSYISAFEAEIVQLESLCACASRLFNTESPSLNVRSGPGLNFGPQGSILSSANVTILDVARTDLEISGNEAEPYWYQIEDENGNIGWITARFVDRPDGCGQIPLVGVEFDVDEQISIDLTATLPEPSVTEGLACFEGETGRADCAAKVYALFYTQFLASNGNPPTVGDFLNFVFVHEFGSSTLPVEVTRATLVNQYLGICANGCTGEKLILNFLYGIQGWYQLATADDELQTTIITGDEEFFSGEGSIFSDADSDVLNFSDIGGRHHGNYPDGSSEFTAIINGQLPEGMIVYGCELIRELRSPVEIEPSKWQYQEWRQQVFVILSESYGQTDTPSWQSVSNGPDWARETFDTEPSTTTRRITGCSS